MIDSIIQSITLVKNPAAAQCPLSSSIVATTTELPEVSTNSIKLDCNYQIESEPMNKLLISFGDQDEDDGQNRGQDTSSRYADIDNFQSFQSIFAPLKAEVPTRVIRVIFNQTSAFCCLHLA